MKDTLAENFVTIEGKKYKATKEDILSMLEEHATSDIIE